jgi:hypothetical protein
VKVGDPLPKIGELELARCDEVGAVILVRDGVVIVPDIRVVSAG